MGEPVAQVGSEVEAELPGGGRKDRRQQPRWSAAWAVYPNQRLLANPGGHVRNEPRKGLKLSVHSQAKRSYDYFKQDEHLNK